MVLFKFYLMMYSTIEEFLESYSFYHISFVSNRESILQRGIEANGAGIYVIRTNNIEVVKNIFSHYLIDRFQLDEGDPIKFKALVIEISSKEHGITKEEILLDHATNSPTLKVQNRIRRGRIMISEDKVNEIEWRGTEPDLDLIEMEMQNHPEKIIEYGHEPRMMQFVSMGPYMNEWVCDKEWF
jgi:hypothetical protein